MYAFIPQMLIEAWTCSLPSYDHSLMLAPMSLSTIWVSLSTGVPFEYRMSSIGRMSLMSAIWAPYEHRMSLVSAIRAWVSAIQAWCHNAKYSTSPTNAKLAHPWRSSSRYYTVKIAAICFSSFIAFQSREVAEACRISASYNFVGRQCDGRM